MNKKIKTALLVLAGVLLLLQFYHPARNESNDEAAAISKKFTVPDSVQAILKSSCYDCHSNYTVYPWYAHIEPMAIWITHHVNEGKEHLDFSEFAAYSPNRQYHLLQQIGKTIQEDEMPLWSYTLIHTYAKLSPHQKELVTNWTDSLEASMQATYPADSLVWKRGKRRD